MKVLQRFIGDWTCEATHPQMKGVITGTASFAWLGSEKFVVWRSHIDHPDVPDGMSVLGDCAHATAEAKEPAKWQMHYFDTRGVYRLFEARLDSDGFEVVREDDAWPQRFRCVLADGDQRIDMTTQLRKDGRWVDDLKMTLRRR